MDEEAPENLLTHDDYDKSKETSSVQEHEKFGVTWDQYQDISDNLLGEVQRKYELRSCTVKVSDPNPNPAKKPPAKRAPDNDNTRDKK